MKTPHRILVKRNKKSALQKKRKMRVKGKLGHGTALRPRLCVFRSSTHIYAQAIDDASHRTLACAGTVESELRTKVKGMKPTEVAKEIGKALAERLDKAGVKEAVFDRSGFRFTGRVAALAQGARDGGLAF